MSDGRPSGLEEPPRFLADVMLGTLARWLRVIGFDTRYDNRIDDDEILRVCALENRIALTRDRRLTERRAGVRSILIHQDDLGHQIRQVLAEVGVPAPQLLFTRCLECNSALLDVSRQTVSDSIPPYVRATQEHFKTCPSCQRIYWGGTHRRRMLEKLDRLLGATWIERLEQD